MKGSHTQDKRSLPCRGSEFAMISSNATVVVHTHKVAESPEIGASNLLQFLKGTPAHTLSRLFVRLFPQEVLAHGYGIPGHVYSQRLITTNPQKQYYTGFEIKQV